MVEPPLTSSVAGLGVDEITFRRFSELKHLPSEPEWLWRGFLAPGALTMLSGHPFVGKSMLVNGLLRALEAGESFLARETTPATAVVVTEEDASIVRTRATKLDLFDLESVYVDRSGGSVGVDWPTLIARATEHALENRHGLLVIDTFPGLAGLRGEEENDAGAVGERLRPLQAAAGNGLAVLFLHHMNAQSQPRGSKAFRGTVDISVRLERKKDAIRLSTESRFATDLSTTVVGRLVKAPDGWFYAAITKEPGEAGSRSSVDERLLTALRGAGANGLTYGDLDRLPGLSSDRGKKRLPTWFRDGRISRTGAGTKIDPYRWLALPC